jgi:hypothetical protein
MPEKLSWTFATRVLGGPTVAGSGEVDVDAYVKLAVTIKKNSSQDVEVFPGAGGSAQLVVISPAKPDPKLTYNLGGTDVPLDGPHILIGSGAVRMLGQTVGTLKVKNDTKEDAQLSIIAGRDATP